MIEQGSQAPDFELPDQDGRTVKLSDFRGEPVVVYFYPKADTPGCTTQACGVRDHQADYARAGAPVLGISPDPVAKVKRFHDKQSLNFPLLADQDHAVAEAFGVWVEKSMYGRTYFGNERTTFVIDPDGRVVQVLRKVKPAEHDKLVLEALKAWTPSPLPSSSSGWVDPAPAALGLRACRRGGPTIPESGTQLVCLPPCPAGERGKADLPPAARGPSYLPVVR